eukprot:CAMPEP_0183342264 /NCGR_PEP_ID=MMETSP0164_2-20130417/8386_1 /TAXON_ID=221442 /ORGANISM="Coccolithus pelagicus ssp braarudi, Strain PLY182g" /LENGTH=77 /DNA_ID=CAMNT_0025512793 /DNA_START=60 /DNA_END=293 /DNA_ORIENTATION=-
MPGHPAKNAEPATREVLKRSVAGGANKSMTKKDGAGGKFTWGTAGMEPGTAALNRGDPNYNSEDEDGVVLQATDFSK